MLELKVCSTTTWLWVNFLNSLWGTGRKHTCKGYSSHIFFVLCAFPPPVQCYLLSLKESLLTKHKTWLLNSSLLWMTQVKHKVSKTTIWQYQAVLCFHCISYFFNLSIIFLRYHGLFLHLKPCSLGYSLYTGNNWKLFIFY